MSRHQTSEYLTRMGEPPSSVEFLLRTIYFNGEAVTVEAPQKSWPVSQQTGD